MIRWCYWCCSAVLVMLFCSSILVNLHKSCQIVNKTYLNIHPIQHTLPYTLNQWISTNLSGSFFNWVLPKITQQHNISLTLFPESHAVAAVYIFILIIASDNSYNCERSASTDQMNMVMDPMIRCILILKITKFNVTQSYLNIET